MNKSTYQHPVAVYSLDPSDKEYHAMDSKGRATRVIIEQVDRERFHFLSSEDAEEFMHLHGMVAVSDAQMASQRATRQI